MSGKLAAGAGGAWRPWSIWLPCALAFTWSGLLVLADGYAAVMGSWDTAAPGLGWLGVGAAGQGVLAAVDVRILVASVKRPRWRGPYHPGMDIREELPGDKEPVREIHLRAFGDHGLVVAGLVDALRETITPTDGLSLVAGQDGQITGHAMFTRSLLDAPRRLVEVYVLSPLGVLPDYQKRGIGSALVRHGLTALADRAVPLVFLEGDPGYYSRFGFAPGRDLGFRKPSLRIPDGAFQAIRLPAYEPWMIGTLVYAEPFWRYDLVGRRDPRA